MASFFNGMNNGSLQPGTSQPPPPQYPPTQDDWVNHRAVITKLYRDEKKKLQDVMKILKQRGFRASEKMYKDRIRDWKLDKKMKRNEMLAMRRIKTERDAIGKKTAFSIRGQPVTMEQVARYWSRQKGSEPPQSPAPPTPPDLTCWTPAPSPGSHLNETDQRAYSNERRTSNVSGNELESVRSDGNVDADEADIEHIPREASQFESFSIDANALQRTVQDLYYIFGAVPPDRPLSPSQMFLIPEKLLYTVSSYVQGSFDSGDWIKSEDGIVKKIIPGMESNADQYMHRDMNIQPRLRYDETMLQEQHPNTLQAFLPALLFFTQSGRQDITNLLLAHVSSLAETILAAEKQTLREIFSMTTMIEEPSFAQAVTRNWELLTDVIESRFGALDQDTVDRRLDLWQMTIRKRDPQEEERLLRVYLEKFGDGNVSRQTLSLRLALGYCLRNQKMYPEAEAMGYEILSLVEADKTYSGTKVNALDLISGIQYRQGKTDSAEKHMREAIQLSTDIWGEADPVTMDSMVRLESLLREWGDEEGADELKAKIDEALGPDDVELFEI